VYACDSAAAQAAQISGGCSHRAVIVSFRLRPWPAPPGCLPGRFPDALLADGRWPSTGGACSVSSVELPAVSAAAAVPRSSAAPPCSSEPPVFAQGGWLVGGRELLSGFWIQPILQLLRVVQQALRHFQQELRRQLLQPLVVHLEQVMFAQVHRVASARSSESSATMPYKSSGWPPF